MVQVETTQISTLCTSWKEKLRSLRDELSNCQVKLQQAFRRSLSREQLLDVEQLHNQIHIQLINIHDLKHAIRTHMKKTDHELAMNKGHLLDDTMAEHEGLSTRYAVLMQTLNELRGRFNRFLGISSAETT